MTRRKVMRSFHNFDTFPSYFISLISITIITIVEAQKGKLASVTNQRFRVKRNYRRQELRLNTGETLLIRVIKAALIHIFPSRLVSPLGEIQPLMEN